MQTAKGSKGGVERPIRTALVLRPVIKEDLRHDLKELTLQHGQAGYELLLPDGSSVSGPGLVVYSGQALSPDLLCKDLVEELIVSAFHGETACVLAMGQTGSGKSHVMGTECRRGPTASGSTGQGWANSVGQYVPRRIFELARKQQLESLEVECAMVEVYSQKQHDSVRDLLALGRPQIDRPAAPLKQLQWFPAADAQQLQSRLLEGSDARETSRTMGNNRSSRSHAIFMIKITHTRREGVGNGAAMTKVSAQLMLVDLAGSEQAALAATGSTTFKEGAGINLGLLSLGGVIEDLAHGNPPQYSNCALTRILKPALGGTANAVIVGCISPLVAHLEYTKRTLLYLAKAGTIKNTVKADVRAVKRAESERSAAEVRELRAQLQKLQLAQSAGSPDSVVLSRAEYQRLVHQAESERLRADSLATMLRHATACAAGPAVGSGALPSSPNSPAAQGLAAASTTADGVARSGTSSSAELPLASGAGAAAVAAEGAGLVREAAGGTPEAASDESGAGQPRGRRSLEWSPSVDAACSTVTAGAAAALQPPGDGSCSPAGQELSRCGMGPDATGQQQQAVEQQQGPQPQARPALRRQFTRAVSISPLLATLASSLATESDDTFSVEAVEASPGGLHEPFSVADACLERESNLDPEQLDLLKVSLDQELRTLRRKRAQQAQQQLSALGRRTSRKMSSSSSKAASSSTLSSVPPQSVAEVQAWAQAVAEQHTSAVGWQYVVDSLQHELGYLQLRLNTLQQQQREAQPEGHLLRDEVPDVDFTLQLPQAADAWQQQQQQEHLRADLAAMEQQLQASQQAQQQAQAVPRESPSQQLGWLGQPGAPAAELVAAALLAELIDTRLQARQLEQQLFQQRLACSTLETSLRAYNSCLGEAEQELADAAAEIQVLHKEREEFQQAIEEKMRYVQQAAAAQNALELLHSEVRQLERQLSAARQESQQPQQSTPPRSLGSSLMAWAGLGRSPSSAAAKLTPGSHASGGGQSPRTSQPNSQANSIPGSPRYSVDGGGGGGNRRSISWHGSEAASPSSSPTRGAYSGSPRDAWLGSRLGEPPLMRNFPLGKQGSGRLDRFTG